MKHITKKVLGILWVGAIAASTLLSSVFASRLYIDPAQGDFIKNCPFKVKVYVDTQGEDILAVDMKTFFTDLEFRWFSMSGWVFAWYAKPMLWLASTWTNKGDEYVYVFGGNGLNDQINWSWLFGELIVESIGDTDRGTVDFYAIPGNGWDDSTISSVTSGDPVDILSSSQWAIFRFVDGNCPVSNTNDGITIDGDFLSADLILDVIADDETNNFNPNKTFVPNKQDKTTLTITLAIILLIIIIIIIVFFRKKKKKDEEEIITTTKTTKKKVAKKKK